MIPQIQYIKLDECAKFSQGKQVPVEEQYAEPFEDSVRFVRIVDFTNENEPPRYIKNYGDSYQVNSNDLIMIRYGSQTAGKVVRGFSGIIANNMFKVDIDRTLFDINFAYYYLSSPKIYKMLMNAQSSSTMPAITFGMLGQIEVPLFNLETQRKIARVLGAIDDKIELNNAINKNLEQQAQAIFKEKVINTCNYEKNGCIGEYCSVKSGFAFKGTWWESSGVKVIKIKTIDNDTINFKDCSYVSEDKVKYAEDFTVQGGDVLIAMTGATIGKFAVIPRVKETLLVNQRVGKFFLGNNPIEKLPFLYCTLKEQDIISEIINRGQGSAQPNISGTDIMTTPCYIPQNNTINEFNSVCKPMFEKIINNKYENEQLTQLRNTLLPKLMNGEIDVDKVEV